MQADFYQLSRDPVEKVLAEIAQRVIDAGQRLLVVAGDAERLDRVDQGLWSGSPTSFLAHGRSEGDRPEIQPILLSTDCAAANGARYIALADGVWRDEALGFERAFYFFDDETVDQARANWRTLSKREGLDLRFWRQEGSRWIKVA